ncbi:MAG: hypothetical protein MJY85_00905 [Fibrobacter sp.]|nr:hypothetical protein [Fibrobacter sp.]
MNITSRKLSLSALLMFCVALLVSCDFQGPWSYFPEERELFRGIYTYGWIESGGAPRICFSKLYALTEASAENFAFYDSAYVTVSGKFENEGETKLVLTPTKDPNCFEATSNAYGIKGESYEMEAFFKWDSAGSVVSTTYSAVATIPQNFGLKGINVPLPMKQYKWVDFTGDTLKAKFLEFPFDMDAYKFAMDYDSTVGGVMLTMIYDSYNGGESMKTTVNYMLQALTEKDSMGYTGVSLHNGFERQNNMGFTANEVIAGIHSLDTIMMTNMTFPIAKTTLRFYATDKAYTEYRNYVIGSFDDPRIVPRSNIENGMGVFSGMTRVELHIDMTSDSLVPYEHIRKVDCANMSDDPDSTWNSKSCRAFGESLCVDTLENDDGGLEYAVDQDHGNCYPIAVKLAMSLDTTKWSIFLPDTISEKKKSEAYADGLKRYCIASNFKSNSIADCGKIHNDCQVTPEKNYCKKYLWQWCSDRDWNIGDYPQCGTGLVSRYYIEKQKSSILERVVNIWCEEHPEDAQCR